MGTDIFVFAEKQKPDRSWELFDEPVPPDNGNGMQPHNFFHNRTYATFAILANVRNGVRTEEPYQCIAPGRGVPNDMSPLATQLYDDGSGWHDETWMFVEEILDFDWTQTIQCKGFIEPELSHLFNDNPMGWPKEEIAKIRGQSMVQTGAAVSMKGGVEVRWRATYASSGRLKYLAEKIKPYRNRKHPKQTRLVMWFSS